MSLSSIFNSSAQNYYPLTSDYSIPLEEILLQKPESHVTIEPIVTSIESKINLTDSLFGKNTDLTTYRISPVIIRVNPIFQSSYLIHHGLMQHQAFGLQIEANTGSHISFQANYAANIISKKPFENTRLDSANLIPNWGYVKKLSNASYFFNQFTFRVNYSVNPYLSFQVGQDKNFFGDGYRSLFLSDNAAPYLFFSTTLNLWSIKYVNQVMILNDYRIGKTYTSTARKYAAMHMLSWNVFKRLNISLFEAVIWQSKDSSGHYRSLDFHYMNPFLVFRPVEYNLGSPDNMLIGLGSRLKLLTETYGYGQLLFDEFYLTKMLAGSEWWANKYAIQLGLKTFRFLTINHLYFQTEINIVRPFTYGHAYPLQNYGYLFQPLAHPQGSNFKELLFRCSFQKNRWIIHGSGEYLVYGLEQPGTKTIGSDIYMSSTNRLIRNSLDDGNFIGQGIPAKNITTALKISYILNSRWGLIAETGCIGSFIIKPTRQNDMMITFGIKTWLFRDEKIF